MTLTSFSCFYYLSVTNLFTSLVQARPHIIFVLVDDLGYYAPGYNNPQVLTPTIDNLARNGVIFTEHYTYRVCAPSRGALMTGRFPYKLSATRNNYRPSAVLDGIDLSYTFLPKKLQQAGYITHHIGKWHLGFYTEEYTPTGRGFHTSNGYLLGAQDYYTQLNIQTFDNNICGNKTGQFYDVWIQHDPHRASCTSFTTTTTTTTVTMTDTSASSDNSTDMQESHHLSSQHHDNIRRHNDDNHDIDDTTNIHKNNEKYKIMNIGDKLRLECHNNNKLKNMKERKLAQGIYNNYRFNDRAIEVIRTHSDNYGDSPLFMYLALQNTHKPLQKPPQKYMDLYSNISYTPQHIFYAMMSAMDDTINNITIALKEMNMWENTVFIWASDNGSPVDGGGSNYPLKGSKASNWEGGVRTPAFLSGGYLPHTQKGKVLSGMIHLIDWYSTCISLAGLSYLDPHGVSAVDGINMWPWISGEIPISPRHLIVYDHNIYNGPPAWGALRIDNYKLLIGPQSKASWYGGIENNYFTPNISDSSPNITITDCDYNTPCLYDISTDSTEHINLATLHPEKVQELLLVWNELSASYHPPVESPKVDINGYCASAYSHNGYISPWI